MALIDLKRVTDLFVEGVEIVFDDNPEEPMLLWMAKLNSFELEECRRDGAAARSRYILALEDPETPEGLVFEARLREIPTSQLIEELVSLRRQEFINEAIIEAQADPEWTDKIQVIQRTLDTDTLTDDEKRVVDKVSTEYAEHLEALVQRRMKQARVDYGQDNAVEDEYRKKWRESRASDRFAAGYTRSQLYYSLRLCDATRVEGVTTWDHAKCKHQRALASPAEVEQLPPGLLERANIALGELAMSRGEARFSGGQPSSSVSSQLPDTAVESPASTQEATPPAPAGTSS
jgi:hypothetical protein